MKFHKKFTLILIIILALFLVIDCFFLHLGTSFTSDILNNFNNYTEKNINNDNYESPEEKSADTICIFVSNNGNDENNGQKNNPYKTIDKATQEAILLIKNNTPVNEIVIFLREGEYNFENTLELNSLNTNNLNTKITYKSYNNEEVYFNGCKTIDTSTVRKAIDISNDDVLNRLSSFSSNDILAVSLSDITFDESVNFFSSAPEVFINDNVMTLSRYPNNDFLTVENVISNSTNNSSNPNYQFTSKRLSPFDWNSNNIYVNGYFGTEWSFSSNKLASLNTSKSLITINENLQYGVTEGSRFYFSNILEELDVSNEYYIDYENKILYFILPADIDNSNNYTLKLSMANNAFINLTSSNNITFDNIIFEYNRANAINIQNCTNINIINCTFRNISANAIDIKNSSNINVENNIIYNIGITAIKVTSGDRNSLTPCNVVISNNEIHDFARIQKTYAPAIYMYGVGITASQNTIYNSPHIAIFFGGNDHIIENNEIYNIALETGDVGAIYSGRDWTARGNIIRYNYIHDSNNDYSEYGVSGIYFDDCMSSAEVYGNILYNLGKGIYCGGGRDFNIYNNMFIDCDTSIRFDGRGESTETELYKQLLSSLNSIPYTSEPWKSKYPELFTIQDTNPGIPNNNKILNNILFNSPDFELSNLVLTYGKVENNIIYREDPGFKNYNSQNFSLKNNSKVFKDIDFENIDINSIGKQEYK